MGEDKVGFAYLGGHINGFAGRGYDGGKHFRVRDQKDYDGTALTAMRACEQASPLGETRSSVLQAMLLSNC